MQNAITYQYQYSLASFTKVTLRETEITWHKLLPNYIEPTLVLFRDRVRSGCGGVSSASGLFYCPADEKLYIDLSFFSELKQRFNAPDDFAMAYVVAHEVGALCPSK